MKGQSPNLAVPLAGCHKPGQCEPRGMSPAWQNHPRTALSESSELGSTCQEHVIELLVSVLVPQLHFLIKIWLWGIMQRNGFIHCIVGWWGWDGAHGLGAASSSVEAH